MELTAPKSTEMVGTELKNGITNGHLIRRIIFIPISMLSRHLERTCIYLLSVTGLSGARRIPTSALETSTNLCPIDKIQLLSLI